MRACPGTVRSSGIIFDLARVGAAALFLVSRESRATPSARLVYLREPSAQCADEGAVRSAVSARLGYDPFVAFARSTLFAEVRRAGKTYRASIKLVDENNVVRGARELSVPTTRCSDLIDAMALSISIAIDPSSLSAPRPAQSEEPLHELPSSSPPEPAIPEPSKSSGPPAPPPTTTSEHGKDGAAKDDPSHLEGALGFASRLGAAPAPSVGALAQVGLRVRSTSVFVEARWDAPASKDVGSDASVRSSLLFATLGACGHFRIFFGCATGSMGELFASSAGIAHSRDASVFHVAGGMRAGVEVGSRWFVRGQVEGSLTLTPHRFEITGREVYALPLFSGALAAFGGARFL